MASDLTPDDLTARLREHADRVGGGGPSDHHYDPETLVLEHEAADRIEALTAERDALAKAKAENDERFQTERDEARAEVAKLREALSSICMVLRDEDWQEAHEATDIAAIALDALVAREALRGDR